MPCPGSCFCSGFTLALEPRSLSARSVAHPGGPLTLEAEGAVSFAKQSLGVHSTETSQWLVCGFDAGRLSHWHAVTLANRLRCEHQSQPLEEVPQNPPSQNKKQKTKHLGLNSSQIYLYQRMRWLDGIIDSMNMNVG